MKTFEELKQTLLDRAKEKKACSSEYRRAGNSKDEAELLTVIKDNLSWCCDNKIIDDEYFSHFDLETFIKSGVANTGEDNKGFGNAGYSNAGNYNAGSRNAGNYNAGSRNAGYYNAGYSNAGNYNAGSRNAGNYNAGYSNAGNYNAGSRNAGYSNAGNDNAGAFNISTKYKMFDKESDWTYEDFRNSKAFDLLHSIDTTLWIPDYAMSEKEKVDYPYYVTTGGYYREIDYKEAFTNKWNNWSDDNKKAFTSLPNFDWAIFTKITGVKP